MVGHGQRHHPGRRRRRRNPQHRGKLRRRNQRRRGGNGHRQHQQLHAHPRVERNRRRQVRDCQQHRADYRQVGNQPGLRKRYDFVQRNRDGQGRRGRRQRAEPHPGSQRAGRLRRPGNHQRNRRERAAAQDGRAVGNAEHHDAQNQARRVLDGVDHHADGGQAGRHRLRRAVQEAVGEYLDIPQLHRNRTQHDA